MSSHVIGTAGHIDHGKSTLVKALTGINPDRLKEEQEREMTIDLGFAYLCLPSGRRVGIVDVPGHERFIRNMLAGASGIDLVLFVVAADEGMMPQSREHLDILNLLNLKKGIIVITKIDLVDDEWLELIENEIREEVKGTFLEGSPVFKVSSKTGEGLEELKNYIDHVLDNLEKRPIDLPARFPIDRFFKVAGFGTVVTGTLWEGKVEIGQVLELLPHGVTVKVRNLQSHGEDVRQAEAALRLAINFSGQEKLAVARGDVLVEPGYYKPTTMVDAELKMLESAYQLKHAEKVHFYLGTKETIGKIRILYQDKLEPGETAYVQIVLEEPVVARRGDRFIIRRLSPVITIGGGTILEPYPERKRLKEKSYIQEFELKKSGALDDLLLFYLDKSGSMGMASTDLKLSLAEKEDKILRKLQDFLDSRKAYKIADRFYSSETIKRMKELTLRETQKLFAENPHLPAIEKEQLRSRLGIQEKRLFNFMLEELQNEGKIEVKLEQVLIPERTAVLTSEEQAVKEELEQIFKAAGVNPPTPEDVFSGFEGREKIAKKIFATLVVEGKLIKIAPDFYLHADTLEEVKLALRNLFSRKERVRVSDIRDALKTSRKYAVPLVEYLDKIKFTRRIGDERILLER
jgi:selenocysteine-specific elongation factor